MSHYSISYDLIHAIKGKNTSVLKINLMLNINGNHGNTETTLNILRLAKMSKVENNEVLDVHVLSTYA